MLLGARNSFFKKNNRSGYVKDGLVLWLDGIDNAGIGKHDPNAVTYKNLAIARSQL